MTARIRSPWTAAPLLLLTMGVLAGPTRAQSISDYRPNPASAGDLVTIQGDGLGLQSPDRSIRYGRGGTAEGSLEIREWIAREGGVARVRVRVALPATIPSGRYWLALYDGGREVARGPETLEVTGSSGGGDPVVIRPAPLGAVAPFQPEVKVVPELSIVSVERTGSGPIEAGGRIPVRVVVRNHSRWSAQVAVGWVGEQPFPAAGQHSEPREVAASSQTSFPLELVAIPTFTRGGRFTTHVALLDPRTFSLYVADAEGGDNSREVSFEVGVPELWDLTVTWTRLMVHDDSDPNGSGEWYVRLFACTGAEIQHMSACTPVATAQWPLAVSGGGTPTMDVTDNRPVSLRPSISLTGIPRDQKVTVFTRAFDDDGLEADERLQSHRLLIDPETWRGWGRSVSRELSRSTLHTWSDNNSSSLEYTGTLIVRASAAR